MFLLFALVVFVAVWAHMAIAACAIFVMTKLELIAISESISEDIHSLLLTVALVSVPIGVLVAFLFSKVPLRPIRDLIDGMDHLASGNFQTRVSVGPIMRRYPAFVGVVDSFNKMAEQLESTEMLRSDFINNFSHEFKTPIVSIAGYAKLLNRGKLTPEQQREYLKIIEEESLRLSNMATNVLNLTKVENQSILTDVTQYNLSEQLRDCILLLESKWTKKNLELELDFGEYEVYANEELLKHVWINLLDNAIKFAPDGHTVKVDIAETDRSLAVTVCNTGSEIAPEHLAKIWNKFYQADESHATQGNGVGLAIVKRVAELHGGSVSVTSSGDVTAFRIKLPKKE